MMSNLDRYKKDLDGLIAQGNFRQQQAILNAVKQRFESSLFDIKQLVQADLFDSELDAAGGAAACSRPASGR